MPGHVGQRLLTNPEDGRRLFRINSQIFVTDRAVTDDARASLKIPALPFDRRDPEEVQRRCTADSLQFDPRFGAGQDVFDALTRMIDRRDPSYRT